MANAKILILNGIGPVVVNVINETETTFDVTYPVQLKPVSETEMTFEPLLDYMVEEDAVHTVLKANVVMVVAPNPGLAETYIKSVIPGAIFVPDTSKIIL